MSGKMPKGTNHFKITERMTEMKAKKRGLLFLLVCAVLLLAPCALQAATFDDVDDNSWFKEAVDYCYDKGYLVGVSDREFGPDVTMSRAMIVTVLYRFADEPAVSGASDFSDVAAGEWYSDAVIWGAEKGIVAGYDDKTFRPDKAVTREEIMAFFYRYVDEISEGDYHTATPDGRILDAFADKDKVGQWSRNAVRWCTSIGLISGAEGNIGPQAKSTRAQVASIIQRLDAYLAGKTFTYEVLPAEGGKAVPTGKFEMVEGALFYVRFVPDHGYKLESFRIITLDDSNPNFAENGYPYTELRPEDGVLDANGGYYCYNGLYNRKVQAKFTKLSGDYKSGMGQLVNRTYPISNAANATVGDLKTVQYSASGRNVQMRAEAAAALDRMIAAYRNENPGSPLYAQSGYRTYAYQKNLYQNQIARKGNNIYAAGVVSAIPGTSEHELGLAADLTYDGNLESSFGSSKQGKWLAAHCREYGFILRYPADQQKVTGIIYEPWHFRYVGKDIAADMAATGADTLEEYYGLALAAKDIDPYLPYLK